MKIAVVAITLITLIAVVVVAILNGTGLFEPDIKPTPTPTPTLTPTPTPTPTYLLKYRVIDTFTTEAVSDVIGHANVRYYDLPDEIVEWPDFALYVVVENLDDVPGVFEVHYTLTTADKDAATRQAMLLQRTPEEWEELNREYYKGIIELYLEPDEVGVAICPLDGIFIAPDRVPFNHEHEIIPQS